MRNRKLKLVSDDKESFLRVTSVLCRKMSSAMQRISVALLYYIANFKTTLKQSWLNFHYSISSTIIRVIYSGFFCLYVNFKVQSFSKYWRHCCWECCFINSVRKVNYSLETMWSQFNTVLLRARSIIVYLNWRNPVYPSPVNKYERKRVVIAICFVFLLLLRMCYFL
jgi:hypothetical protein